MDEAAANSHVLFIGASEENNLLSILKLLDGQAVLTVSEKVNDYAAEVMRAFAEAGIRAIADTSADKLGAKIRNARNLRVPYLAVVGLKEAEQRGVSVRSRDENKELGLLKLDELIARLRSEALPPSLRSGQTVERKDS